jgi:hypothetical protein
MRAIWPWIDADLIGGMSYAVRMEMRGKMFVYNSRSNDDPLYTKETL